MKRQYYSPIKESGDSQESKETPESPPLSEQNDGSSNGSEEENGKESFKLTRQQWTVFAVISVATLSAAFSICLFPPFYPKIAEDKGATASIYGFIIGTNCLTSFLVTPFIGNHLNLIGVRFAFVAGMLISGVCCALSGFLEFFPPGASFIGVSIAIRVIHAIGNSACVVSTFTYSAVEFPDSVARIFSWTRLMMSVAQMAGPIVGGALYEIGGFKMPFLVMGSVQTVLSLVSLPLLPDYSDDYEKDGRPKPTFKDILQLLCIPAIWIPFMTFIVSTMSNGFLSINLEPKVLRNFGMSPLMVGLFFGLKDGANSVASPIWGYLCDTRGSVRVHIIVSTLLGALSLFLIGPFPFLPLEQTLATVGIALVISGIGFSGQQVAGVVDALRELVFQGFPDSPSTHGLVAGLWTSFSGAGRFISRAGTGILVDHVGFQMSSVIMLFAQLIVVFIAVLHSLITAYKEKRRPPVPLSLLEAGKPGIAPEAEFRPPHFHLSVMESGDYGQLSVTVSQPSSPVESLTVKSISIPVPRKPRHHEPRHRSGTVAGYPS